MRKKHTKKKSNYLSKLFGENLTDNFHANLFFLFLITVFYLFVPFINKALDSELLYSISYLDNKKSLIKYFYFIIFYLFAAYWFSPDLDLRNNRPGKYSFPFGPIFKVTYKIGSAITFLSKPMAVIANILRPIHTVIDQFWNYYWKPLSLLFTHRGFLHWPIFGTIGKLTYVYFTYFFTINTINIVDIYIFNIPLKYEAFLKYSSPEKILAFIRNNEIALIFIISVTISDILHSLVDAIDSFKKGSNFVPPEGIAPRGFFHKFYSSIIRIGLKH